MSLGSTTEALAKHGLKPYKPHSVIMQHSTALSWKGSQWLFGAVLKPGCCWFACYCQTACGSFVPCALSMAPCLHACHRSVCRTCRVSVGSWQFDSVPVSMLGLGYADGDSEEEEVVDDPIVLTGDHHSEREPTAIQGAHAARLSQDTPTPRPPSGPGSQCCQYFRECWQNGKNGWRTPLHLGESEMDFCDELPEWSGTFRQRSRACQSLRRPR